MNTEISNELNVIVMMGFAGIMILFIIFGTILFEILRKIRDMIEDITRELNK